MPLDAPFRLGQFMVDRQGRLLPGAPDATPTLFLQWRGLAVSVRLAAAGGADGGNLAMSAVIGRVPSTASDPGGSAGLRTRALATIDSLAAGMDNGWRLRLLADHTACIEAARGLALPATASALLTAVTCFLLELAPYLDLLAEPDCGVEAPGGKAGMVKICPG